MIIDQTKIKDKKNHIQELIQKDFITNDDIKSLLNKSFDEILKYSISRITKERLLYKIYLQPYLLCDDELSKINVNLIVELMIKRYTMEISEINYLYKEGSISLKDYYRYIDSLVYAYFNTSEIGKTIYENYGGNFELSDLFQENDPKIKDKH